MPAQNVETISLDRLISLGDLDDGVFVVYTPLSGVLLPSGVTLGPSRIIGVTLHPFRAASYAGSTSVPIPVGSLSSSVLSVRAGGEVFAGNTVISDSTGRAVRAVTATPPSFANLIGLALTAATAAGQFIDVLVTNNRSLEA